MKLWCVTSVPGMLSGRRVSMLKRRILLAAVMSAALVASLLVLPSAVSAQSTGAYLAGAEPWTEANCAGDVPIVVGSDAKAQSDIYSAVTLAGVVDTDCVVLAGPRDEDMPADQLARLGTAATGGYVLGGAAAVPEAKVAGRNLMRVGGATRWETAQLIGSQARALAEGQTPGTPGVPDTTLSAPSDVQQPGVFLDGAEPWIASDCVGDVPIVVGSDSKAQSDIYSAVTLAGVVGTDCVVLAGPRNGDVPASQQTRLDAAESGGYVLGGTAAVPTAKIAGRDMTRFGGNTRWETAQLVGRRASGDTTVGTSTKAETTESAEEATSTSQSFSAVSAGYSHSCGLRANGTVVCWGYNGRGQSDAPSGKFSSVSAGSRHSCGVRTDGTADCWGNNKYGQSDAPSGAFMSVFAGSRYSCGLRADGKAVCWGDEDLGLAEAPPQTFAAIAGSWFQALACGLQIDGTVACWGSSYGQHVDEPAGPFTAVSLASGNTCGIRTDETVVCWGDDRSSGILSSPSGTFASLDAGSQHSCGVRTDGMAVCWGNNEYGQSDAPSGKFSSVSAGYRHSCGVRVNGSAICWGDDSHGKLDPPRDFSAAEAEFTSISVTNTHACGLLTDLTIICRDKDRGWGEFYAPKGAFAALSLDGEGYGSCGLRTDGTVVCWNSAATFLTVEGSFAAVAGNADGCGVRTDGTVACWTIAYSGELDGELDAPSGSFTTVSVGARHSCGVRTDGAVVCWGAANSNRELDAPSGSFIAVSAGTVHTCGVRADGTVTCWGNGQFGQLDAPPGRFTAINAGNHDTCGVRADGTVACWGSSYRYERLDAPSGKFIAVSVSHSHSCGVRADGTLACWDLLEDGRLDEP